MIWGMTLEPGKLYTEIMGEEVQLSMAAIDSRKDFGEGSNSFCQIMMKTSKSEYVLCTLVNGVMFQQSLDLKLMPREKVTFSVQGPNVVYLVGYTASYPEDEEGELDAAGYQEGEDASAWESYDDDVMVIQDDGDGPPMIKREPGTEEELMTQTQLNHQTMNYQTGQDRLQGHPHGVPDSDPGQTMIKTEASSPRSDPPIDPSMQLPQDDTTPGMEMSTELIGMPQTSTSEDFLYQESQQQQPSDLLVPPPQAFLPGQVTDSPHQIPQSEPNYPPAPLQGMYIKTEAGTVPTLPAAPKRTPPPPRRQVRAGMPSTRTRTPPQSAKRRNTAPSTPGTSGQGIPAGASSSGVSLQTHQGGSPQVSLGGPMSKGRSAASPRAPSKTQGAGQRQRDGYLCGVCSRGFKSVAQLTRHERIHTGERPFSCRFCEKTFARRFTLTNHERLHTGERPFVCRFCSKAFTQRVSLVNHKCDGLSDR